MANALFAIFASDDPEKLGSRITEVYGSFSRSVSDGEWLIVTPSAATSKEISDALGITDGTNGPAIVVRVEGYFGRAASEIWEWIGAKSGAEIAQSV